MRRNCRITLILLLLITVTITILPTSANNLAQNTLDVTATIPVMQSSKLLRSNAVFNYQGDTLQIAEAYVLEITSNAPWQLEVQAQRLPGGLQPQISFPGERDYDETVLIRGKAGKHTIIIQAYIPASSALNAGTYHLDMSFLLSSL